MSAKIIGLKRKPRPLKKTYDPTAPYTVERHDMDEGDIHYEVWDHRQESYRRICSCIDSWGDNPYAKHDAEQTARGLNILVQYGLETLPKVRDRHDD